jgi:tetratricopeptide (TPR) repeat protein
VFRQHSRIAAPLLFALCLWLLAGCAGSGPALFPQAGRPVDIELADVPFFPQKAYQCGPAALATVLGASGVSVAPDDLAPALYLPDRQGSLQLELVAAARRLGRVPYIIDPEPAAIRAELLAGRPVLVLQNLGLRLFPVYHYAVVVGIRAGEKVVLRSGEVRRRVMKGGRFAASWRRADSWGMVVLRPGELPAGAQPERYLRAVAPFEGMGRSEIARAGYEATLKRWPEQPDALFGLANILLIENRPREAAAVYRRLLTIQPRHPAAVNNLAEAMSRQSCHAEAVALLDGVLAAGEGGEFANVLKQTRQEIAARRQQSKNSRGCVPVASGSLP